MRRGRAHTPIAAEGNSRTTSAAPASLSSRYGAWPGQHAGVVGCPGCAVHRRATTLRRPCRYGHASRPECGPPCLKPSPARSRLRPRWAAIAVHHERAVEGMLSHCGAWAVAPARWLLVPPPLPSPPWPSKTLKAESAWEACPALLLCARPHPGRRWRA